MQADDVAALYSLLMAQEVRSWLGGGWGIDALLERQTRPHKDMDLMIRFEDAEAMIQALVPLDFTLKYVWEENRWVKYPVLVPLIGRQAEDFEVATAFILEDGSGRELDVHLATFDAQGCGTPVYKSDDLYPAEAFTGRGVVAGTPVRCLSARIQMVTHTGYTLQDKDRDDLRYLHERFGVEYPSEVADLFVLKF